MWMRFASCSLAGLLLVAAVAHAQGTDEVAEVSPERAKQLAQNKSGRLLLNGLTSLSPETAKELARFDGWLSLNGLVALPKEVADALAQHKGPLHLDGLKTIPSEAASALARHYGELSLNGVTSLSDEAAQAFAKHTGGRLYLNGVTSLSPAAAQAMSQRKGGAPSHQVRLDGLTSLSAEEAEALAGMNGHQWEPRFPRLKTVPVDVARALAKRDGISMEGLTSLSDEAAMILGPKLNGRLPALKELSPEVAKSLAKVRGSLILDGLTELADDAAAALGKDHSGDLHLNGLKKLSPAAAQAICKRGGDLHLNGLTEIPLDILKAMAAQQVGGNIKPRVHLKGLATLSDEAAAILSSWPKWSGELPALTTLSEKAGMALAGSRNWNGHLPSLKTVSPEVARAIAGHKGNLSLDGLTTLTEDSAKELTKHQGGPISLNGLNELSEPAAVALAAHPGRLALNGLASVSDGVAAAFVKHRGDWLFLDGVASLSEEGARALAQHSGIVSLKGLQKISEASLGILRAHPRIALAGKLRAIPTHASAKADAKTVAAFLEANCMSCHGGKRKEGDFAMDKLTFDSVAGRVAYASILERLRAGDMPPSEKDRPDPVESAAVARWIASSLDAPLSGPATYYAVKDKPVDGNRLPHAILFGGPRGPSLPPPPRLWRLSPMAYVKSLSGLNVNGLQQPFGLLSDAGFKDFSALYAPDEGATSLLLTNAEQVVLAQTRPHALVNILEKAEAAKETLWPNESRIKAATAEERKHLEKGDRVRQGNGVFAPLMHPKVAASRNELEKALRQQYQTILSRPPNDRELESLLDLYKEVAKEGDYALAGRTVLMAPLMTPEAILRFEVGLGAEMRPGVRMLSPRESAFAISLALSDQRDLGLLSAAAQGKLTTREEVASALRTILDDPKIGKPRVLRFFREYFDYYRAPEVFKDPLPDYLQRRGVHYSARQYVEDTDVLVLAILSRDQDVLKELLTTTDSYRTHELFGASEDGLRNGHGSLFRKFSPYAMEHRQAPRADNIGIPMQPSWLVAWSVGMDNDIVRRGRWVREKLLGGRVPDLPINVQAMVPEDPHRTLRERQMVTRVGACWKCHYRMDDLGTPFEHVDHYGFLRSTEPVLDLEAMKSVKDKKTKIYREAPLDTTGFIRHSGDPALDGPVKDAPEMLRRLAESDRVRQVFVRHVFRFFLGRNETPGDAPTLQEADRAYLESGGSFKAILVSLLSSESFLYRTIPAMGYPTNN
jgi:mono/diheme cytochrome c family protein